MEEKKLLPMKKILSLSLFLLLIWGTLLSQVRTPCCTAPNVPAGCAEAGTSIANACVICSLAGVYQGNNSDYGATGDFSCGVPHNSAYVSVLGDANGVIDATILTTNCITGEGLQLVLWDQMGNEIDCFSIRGAPTATVGATGLTPGGLYTFQIDGFNGDACDYTIIVTQGTPSSLPDPPPTLRTNGDTLLCPGDTICFETDRINNANVYNWSFPSNLRIISGGGPLDRFLCCVAEREGNGIVEMIPSNFCFNGIPGILPIRVLPGIVNNLPPVFRCSSQFPFDTTICDSTYSFTDFGDYRIVCETTTDCDDIIILSLIPSDPIPQFPDSSTCLSAAPIQLPILADFVSTWSGNGVLPNGTFDPQAAGVGTHQVMGTFTKQACTYSSTASIEVFSSPKIDEIIDSPIWSLNELGIIYTNVTEGTPPYQFLWSNANTTSDQIDQPPGEYCLTVTDQNGCETEECYQINNGFSVTPIHIICPGDRVNLTITPSLGATFSWSPAFRLSCNDCSNPQANPRRSTVYTVTATLPDGRSASQNVVVIVLPEAICNGLPTEVNFDYAKIISKINFLTIEEKDLIEIEERLTDYYLKKEVKIAPNPTDGIVNILTHAKVETVDVFDFSGKRIMTAFEKEVDLSNFSKGVYFFKIKVENEVIVKRVVLF